MYPQDFFYKLMPSMKRDSFASFFIVSMPFMSYSWLTALSRTSTTMLSWSGETKHPCLILNFRERHIFIYQRYISCAFFPECFLKSGWRSSFLLLLVEFFYHERVLEFFKCFPWSNSHVRMWELDYKESWAPKNWCLWTVVLEKTLESPLDCKEIQSVHSKGDQSSVFIGRTDAKA